MALLTCMKSYILWLERVETDNDDEEQVEEKDQEPRTDQSIVSPLEPVLPSASHYVPTTVADSMSSLAFNLPPCLSPISMMSDLPSPPSGPHTKGKMRTDAPLTILYTANLPHPSAATMATTTGTSTGVPLGIGQLKLEVEMCLAATAATVLST